MSERIEYTEVSPEGVEALGDVYDYVTSSTRTSDSPDLRVSQINGCAYCVDMHTRGLINKGVSADKLVLVPLWREASSLFDKRVAMTAVFAQSESNSIRCWTNENVNERDPFTNSENTP
jgi:AhpD family alkylhydroperoxidase